MKSTSSIWKLWAASENTESLIDKLIKEGTPGYENGAFIDWE